mmetsp:Transcript_4968/g.9046  ORF Transcript_4968/g.9046 Transcript_4968/m.9046 type:complete len:134 (+) Transcript_4968:325-726(+)
MKMSPSELYRTFVIPQITHAAADKPDLRNHLLSNGGREWMEVRTKEFASGSRQRTDECPKAEKELRSIETRVILKIAYPGDVNAGIYSICEREPTLATSTTPQLKSFLVAQQYSESQGTGMGSSGSIADSMRI